MPINWDSLEQNIEQYLQRGVNEPLRTPIQVAQMIEDLYIREVTSSGREQYGNFVISLPRGPFAAVLTAQFKASLGIEPPKIDLKKLSEDKFNEMKSKAPKPPSVPYQDVVSSVPTVPKATMPTLPKVSFSLAMPPLPGLPPKKLSLSVPQIPSREDSENEVRKRLSLPPIPSPPPVPLLDAKSLAKVSLSAVNVKMPEIPNPVSVKMKSLGTVASMIRTETEQIKQMIRLSPPTLSLPPMPSIEKYGIKVPTIPVDTNLLKLNAVGTSGVILTWAGALMGITVPPPGFAQVATNMVVNPGAFSPMKSALGGPKFTKELVNSLKMHSKTISGLVTGVTPSGSPIVVPWVGIS